MSRRFVFTEHWVLPHAPERVHAVLVDLEHYPDWWPQVLAVAKIDDDTARVLCRSRLPYTLDLVLVAVHREPQLLETRLDGDLVGVVRWRLGRDPAGTRLDFEQQVDVGHRGLAAASRPLARLLAWNHGRMMAGCRAGLAQRLASTAS